MTRWQVRNTLLENVVVSPLMKSWDVSTEIEVEMALRWKVAVATLELDSGVKRAQQQICNPWKR